METVKKLSEKCAFPEEDQANEINLMNIAVSRIAVKFGGLRRNLTVTADSKDFKSGSNPYLKNFNISLTLPNELFEENLNSKVLFVLYRKTNFFKITEGVDARARIRSYVIAASVPTKEIKNLKEDVVIRYQDSKNISVREAQCVFWDFRADEYRGDWSTAGCKLQRNEYDECHCNHLTNFAMLLVSFFWRSHLVYYCQSLYLITLQFYAPQLSPIHEAGVKLPDDFKVESKIIRCTR